MLTVARGQAATRKPPQTCSRKTAPIKFGYDILSVTPEQGIARWWASFVIVPHGLRTKLDGIFLISLDENGRCRSLREWWHKLQD